MPTYQNKALKRVPQFEPIVAVPSGTLGPDALGRELGVSGEAVRSWAAAQIIPSITTAAGWMRIPAEVAPILQDLHSRGVHLNARRLKPHKDEIGRRLAAATAEDPRGR